MPILEKSKQSSTAVRHAVVAVLSAAGVGTCLPLATANAADEPVLQEIVVTGSILRRTDLETPSPMTIVSAETMEQRGLNTVSEAVQRLSANNAGAITNGWNNGFNFASGANAPALRGLTVQSTLSVGDGLRIAPYPLADDGQRNFVDLNTIPSGIVDRIEVLRDGASSTYGADAIAGVVNVITKKEIKGWHFGTSYGDSEDGGGQESRIDATFGKGDLQEDGYNFYISGEYQKQQTLDASDRGYPYNTADLQRTCNSDGSCLANHNWNGVTDELVGVIDPATGFDHSFNGLFSIPGVTLVRPVTSGTATSGSGRYQFLDAAAGCRQWTPVTITATQSATSPLTTCVVDYRNEYLSLQPEIERMGLSMRFTAGVGENAEFYAMGNFYKTDTNASLTPLGFNGAPVPPRLSTVAQYNVLLPVYVCPTGVGTLSGLNTGCDATNGTLNPYNPFASLGQRAQALLRNPRGRTVDTSSRTYRVAVGLDGSFGDGWGYSGSFSASEVDLTRTQNNYMVPQRIMDVVANGSFNFADPYANSEEMWDYISPIAENDSTSRLWQLQGLISKDLMDLSGGALQAALGVAYRDESITSPSANPGELSPDGTPAFDASPYDRYYSLNAVAAKGSRNVKSAFFEVSAPIVEQFELIASGRYDDYSSGQSNFSPKAGFKFTPIDSFTLRGTWSEGFRIPSFNEAFGDPTTGYVTRSVNCGNPAYATFCAAHTSPAYYTGYALGLTQTGNEDLDPEESTSYTVGIIFQPMSNLTLTLDWWQIEVDKLISGVTSTGAVEDQYYSNNGVVTIPGFTVVPGVPDQANPTALPVLGFIQTSYANQDSQKVSGWDVGATMNFELGSVMWTSSIEASYLQTYELTTADGTVLKYDGTLSPCNITSCSGAPEWRGSWQNTFQFGDTSLSVTTYYTKGYDTASIDFGGVKGDCQFNADNAISTAAYVDGSPFDCVTDDQWNVDMTVRHQVNDKLTVFADILNVFDIEAEFDPAAAYALYNFNPAWGGPNVMGRYFRVGTKWSFE